MPLSWTCLICTDQNKVLFCVMKFGIHAQQSPMVVVTLILLIQHILVWLMESKLVRQANVFVENTNRRAIWPACINIERQSFMILLSSDLSVRSLLG